jgi:hypothetical protein
MNGQMGAKILRDGADSQGGCITPRQSPETASRELKGFSPLTDREARLHGSQKEGTLTNPTSARDRRDIQDMSKWTRQESIRK